MLLHGGLAVNSTWAAQFAGLSPHRHVVAPERQAQGHTPDRPGASTYQAMADQTVGFLVASGLDRWIFGWSDGGMVGTLIARRTTRNRPNVDRHWVWVFKRRLRPGSNGRPRGPFAGRQGHGDVCCHVRPSLPGRSRALPGGMGKDAHDVGGAFDWTGQVGRSRHRPSLSSGMMTTSAWSTPRSSRIVANGQLAVVPGASHLVPMEKPDLFNQLVLEFTANPYPETMMPLRRNASD